MASSAVSSGYGVAMKRISGSAMSRLLAKECSSGVAMECNVETVGFGVQHRHY